MKFSLARVLLFVLTGTITVLVSLTWEVIWRLASVMEYGKYWVLSSIYLGAAATLLALNLALERRYPRMSIKLFQASMTIGIACYFMPGVATFYSMKFMSPGVAALVMALVPLWLWIYRIGDWRKKLPSLLFCSLAVIVFFWGSTAEEVSAREWFILLVLFVSSFLYATGLAFTRRIFWMHYGLELNFWAMGFAACLFALMSFLFGEVRSVPENFQTSFVLYFGILSIVILGGGTFFYRYVAHQPRLISTMTLTLGIPLLAVIWSWLSDSFKTPLNVPCVISLLVFLVTLGVAGVGERSAAWMTHFLTNTRRVGERVVCKMSAFMKAEKGALTKIDIVDLSIGGVGFTCDDPIVVGNKILVSIPLGEGWTQVSVEAKIVHAVKIPDRSKAGQIRWHGGLMFINLPEDRLQPLVEFLAGMGRSGEG